MLYPLKLYVKDRWIALPSIVTFFLLLFSFWYVFSMIHPTSELVFLHYNILFGVDLIGEWWKIWFIPVISLFACCLNSALAYYFYNNNRFLARFLASATTFVEVLAIIGMVLIIGLNN